MNLSGIIFFIAIIIGTLTITYSAAKRTVNTNDFYAAGNRLSGLQNGLAISGDYMSAASFMGITGAIALYGFDGFFYSIGFLVSYLVILLTVAEPLHNLGRFTIADAIAFRFDAPLLRVVIALNTLIITIFYMIAQLVGAGALVHMLLGFEYSTAVIIVGTLMTLYVAIGGMLATSWVQIIKAVLLLSGTLMVSLIVWARFDWNPLAMFERAATATPLGQTYLKPGNMFSNPLDMFSLHLALIMGSAGLPHILIRFFTVKDAVTTRYSVVTAIGVIGSFYIMTIFLGLGAVTFVDWDQLNAGFGGNLTVSMLARALGGDFLMAFISAVAFATILAVVTGLVISASSAFSHDFYNHILRKGTASEREQIKAARASALSVGIVSTLLAIGAEKLNVAMLVSLAFAVAASANLPLILFTIYWKSFNTAGAISGILTGLCSSVILVVLSPHIMDPAHGWIAAEPVFPLKNPGIVSIPLGFFGAWLGSLLTRNRSDQGRYKETRLQAHVGIRPRHRSIS